MSRKWGDNFGKRGDLPEIESPEKALDADFFVTFTTTHGANVLKSLKKKYSENVLSPECSESALRENLGQRRLLSDIETRIARHRNGHERSSRNPDAGNSDN